MSNAEPAGEPRLHFWDAYWDHRPAECPCDEDFIHWLDARAIRDAAIYHFGTGGHHHVGIECARPERRNSVLGITAAPREHAAYVELAIAHPEVLRYYSAVFGDIYLLNPSLLPVFDVVTLFHLCEFRGPQNDAYGGLTDRAVLDRLTDKLRPGGHMLFYPGSCAWDRAEQIVARWAREADVESDGRFRSLVAYRKRG